MSESNKMFNERDWRCDAVQLMLSTDPSYDNRTIASILKMKRCCIAVIQTVYIYMWKHNQQSNYDERTHFFRIIYLSPFILERIAKELRKVMCVRAELETEQTAKYWPQVPLVIATLLPQSAGLLNWGPEDPSPLSWAGFPCFKLQLELQQTDSN